MRFYVFLSIFVLCRGVCVCVCEIRSRFMDVYSVRYGVTLGSDRLGRFPNDEWSPLNGLEGKSWTARAVL